MELSQQYLKSILKYDPTSGVWSWINCASKNVPVGKVAGTVNGFTGYRSMNLNGKRYYAHRLAFTYVTGVPLSDSYCVDHINGVRDDNRWDNLRCVTTVVNNQNLRKAKSSNQTSGLLGVSWNKKASKWRSYINICGKQVHLGFFEDKYLAYAAYVTAKRAGHAGGML